MTSHCSLAAYKVAVALFLFLSILVLSRNRLILPGIASHWDHGDHELVEGFETRDDKFVVNSSWHGFALAFAACGPKYCDQMIDGLETAIAQIGLDQEQWLFRLQVPIVLVTDNACSAMLDCALKSQWRNINNVVRLLCYGVEILEKQPHTNLTLFARCSPVRLYLLRILEKLDRSISRILYIDSDAMVSSSLASVAMTMSTARKTLYLSEDRRGSG
jgi:hypothetical protein